MIHTLEKVDFRRMGDLVRSIGVVDKAFEPTLTGEAATREARIALRRAADALGREVRWLPTRIVDGNETAYLLRGNIKIFLRCLGRGVWPRGRSINAGWEAFQAVRDHARSALLDVALVEQGAKLSAVVKRSLLGVMFLRSFQNAQGFLALAGFCIGGLLCLKNA